MNHDGTKNGFANEALAKLSSIVNIPIIASGGAGTIDHFSQVFKQSDVDGALAASVFHKKVIEIKTLKSTLTTCIHNLYLTSRLPLHSSIPRKNPLLIPSETSQLNCL